MKREVRFAQEKADNQERSKGSELSALLTRHNREITDMEELLRTKQRALDELSARVHDKDSEMERLLREKEEELEIFKAGMDQTLTELNDLRVVLSPPIPTPHAHASCADSACSSPTRTISWNLRLTI